MNEVRVDNQPAAVLTPLRLDADELVACVSCGLCLPHCPTYRVTGLEIASPRGRIAAMRAVELDAAPIDAEFRAAMGECVQCRGCEAACPSGVHFGHLIEDVTVALAGAPDASISRWARARTLAERVGFGRLVARQRLVRFVSWVLWIAQRLHLVPKRLRAQLPTLRLSDLRQPEVVRQNDPDVWLFTGCVMDAWMRRIHVASATVLREIGVRPSRQGPGGGCCGALAQHAGLRADAQRLATDVIRSLPGSAAVLVNSAGCGAAMREYGRLLGTPEAHEFSTRVMDISEWLAQADRGAPGEPGDVGRKPTVVIQDPCHLRHVQRSHQSVRSILREDYELVETDDDGLCCGAGGAYGSRQAELSARIARRKIEALNAAGAAEPGVVVCSANPGCIAQLQAGGFEVCHPMELLARTMTGDGHHTDEIDGAEGA